MKAPQSLVTERWKLFLAVTSLLLLAACRCDDEVQESLASLVVLPDTLDFGDVARGTDAEKSLTLRSDGNVSLRLDGISIQNTGSPVFTLLEMPDLGTTLSHGSSEQVRIAYAPGEEGVDEAVLVIESNDPDSPALVPITGRTRSATIRVCHAVDDPDAVDLDCAEPGEPLLLDFGAVVSGESSVRRALIRNVGAARLVIEEPVLDQASLAAGFSPLDFPSETSIPRGGGVEIAVSLLGSGQGEASGRVAVRSNDPDYPEAFVDLLAEALPNSPPSACAGATRRVGIDGRVSEPEEPLVEIDARPWDRVYLTAHPFEDCSNDPEDGLLLEYEWRVTEQPEGQGASIHNEGSGPSPVITPQQPPPYVDISGVGIYRVELIVTDTLGASSSPAEVVIDARPEDDLIVELAWEAGVDLDLHLLAPGSSPIEERAFCDPLDCFWDTCRPDDSGIPTLHWGSVGGVIGDDRDPGTDPILRFDNFGDSIQPGTERARLETISLLRAAVVEPALGPYLVGVGYFDARGRAEDVTATVTVIHAGEVLFESERVFGVGEEKAFWVAGSYDATTGTGEALDAPVFDSLPYSGLPGACE